ncbi:MAG: hypothetical protein RL713_1691 [Bacteroidota bacterium]|jgi:membrane-bound ClpP family serine protease
MKKLFSLMLAFLVISTSLWADDIADVVIERNGYVSIKDASNKLICSAPWTTGWELCGFSNSIIVVKESNGYLYVRDRKFQVISTKAISSDEKVKSVVGNNIVVKKANGRVTTFDKKFNILSERYE